MKEIGVWQVCSRNTEPKEDNGGNCRRFFSVLSFISPLHSKFVDSTFHLTSDYTFLTTFQFKKNRPDLIS